MAKQTADLVIENIGELVTCAGPADGRRGDALQTLEIVKDGAIAVTGGLISGVGTTQDIAASFDSANRIDATGRLVTPGLVDPHSHLVYSGSRHDEWEFKVTGRAADTGLQGGIHRSVGWTRAASDEAMASQALADLDEMAEHGTTTLEAKTGYGLERETELRLLRLTAGLEHPVDVIPTFLGAHVPPREYLDDTDAYVDLVIDMLPEAAELAEYCDVCCDPIGFTRFQCRRIGERAKELGLGIRVHSDQTGDAEGGFLAAELNAASADHADYTSDEGFRAMAEAGTAAILFPGVTYHMLEMTPALDGDTLVPAEKPFMPQVARRAVDAGCNVALSTDYNPGSCPTLSMQAAMQTAARLYRLGYAEIWHMSTLNAAASLGRGHDRGSIEPGKRADIVIWRVPEHGMVIHRFGTNLVDDVFIDGRQVVSRGRRLAA
ncbi:MAG: imidazolonepropionase [Alphaproteobacteria bacterium]|nr:imidazolonepropionase [Alphaproteobacteria bacterium]